MTAAAAAIDDELAAFEDGRVDPADFPHREHLRVAYEMLGRCPFGETVTRFSRGLRHLAQKTDRPQLYHETITIAFLAVIDERKATTNHICWSDFIVANEDLLDKNTLHRWYSPDQLQSDLARKTFCLPVPLTSKKAIAEGSPTGDEMVSRLLQAINAYTLLFYAYIAWSSIKTALQAYGHNAPVLALALTETFAIALFALRPTRTAGLALLLLVFATAFLAELASGGSPLRFVLYAATAGLIWRSSLR